MKFKFEANQEHQVQAIESTCGLFEGQPRIDVALDFKLGSELSAVANRLDVDDGSLLTNLRVVQGRNGLPLDAELLPIEIEIETPQGPKTNRFHNFSIEMETGTGKTYVYLRTALELFRRFGLRKFIVVVPSVAIREGVLTDLRITQGHFRDLYGNLPYRYSVYSSTNLAKVRQFALSESVEFLIMTIDSFNKASNIMRQPTDWLQGDTPIHLVQAARPILILDEPQNMESQLSIQSLASLDPLLALRYSATHRNPYNAIYRLTPFEAYRQGLVKRIEVASVIEESEESQPYIRLDRVSSTRRTVTARLAIHQLMRTGAIREKTVTVKPGDSLKQKSGGRTEYDGYEVDEIGSNFVRFANNAEARLGEALGADREAMFEAQIAYTVEEHFRRQERLRQDGIKVLSLFFIDRVDNYALDNGLIRQLFYKCFNELKPRYQNWTGMEPENVQAAYFAQRRRKSGSVEYIDSSSGETKEDQGAYELIMRDKERLLSLDEPVAFIFSHSALREGWDNPNVFQICTLNQTQSELKKRQEVGRGVRLCRDQSGERIHDEQVNVLTVVANESYERYVSQLQAEIETEYGPEGVPPPPPNARKRGKALLRKQQVLRPEFRELWDRIKYRTRYAVRIDTQRLLAEVLPAVDKIKVRAPRVAIRKARVRVSDSETFEALQMSAAKTVLDLEGRYPLPNLLDVMANLMQFTSPPVRLTRTTLLQLFERTTNKRAALANAQEFATAAVRILKEALADELVRGIQYEKLNNWYEMAQLQTDIESWEQYLVPATHAVYDHIVVDSQVERKFVEDLERRDDVRLYFKLPDWFTVPTPVGEYNPDWAIVMEDRDPHGEATGQPLLYLVRETKGATWQTGLRPSERRKIACGEKHFKDALGVDYKVVSTASELP
jgi:type III restriction enzyme